MQLRCPAALLQTCLLWSHDPPPRETRLIPEGQENWEEDSRLQSNIWRRQSSAERRNPLDLKYKKACQEVFTTKQLANSNALGFPYSRSFYLFILFIYFTSKT